MEFGTPRRPLGYRSDTSGPNEGVTAPAAGSRLVDFIKERKVKAIFVESSVPHVTIERIAQDARVKVGGELFSDAMGTPGEIENGYDLGTYEGMVKHNLTTIVEDLK